jgi:hypothetical protein
MTTTLPIPAGPTNREIIDRAWSLLGTSDSLFGRTPEEYAGAMAALGPMMLEWPYDGLGFIYEDQDGLRVEEESGIERKWMEAVAHGLARRIASSGGFALQPAVMKEGNRLYSRLCATYPAPRARFVQGTPAGAGNRWPFSSRFLG